MIKPVIATCFFALVGVGCVLAPIGAAARSNGSHASAHVPIQTSPNWHHRKTNRFLPYGYSYYPPYLYYDSGESDGAAPSQPKEKPVAETRRECDESLFGSIRNWRRARSPSCAARRPIPGQLVQ